MKILSSTPTQPVPGWLNISHNIQFNQIKGILKRSLGLEKSCFEEQGKYFAPFEGELGPVRSWVVGPQVDARTEGDESQVSL